MSRAISGLFAGTLGMSSAGALQPQEYEYLIKEVAKSIGIAKEAQTLARNAERLPAGSGLANALNEKAAALYSIFLPSISLTAGNIGAGPFSKVNGLARRYTVFLYISDTIGKYGAQLNEDKALSQDSKVQMLAAFASTLMKQFYQVVENDYPTSIDVAAAKRDLAPDAAQIDFSKKV